MGSVRVANNAYSTLAGGISAVATTLSVAAGEGGRFPAVTTASGDYFYATLIDTSNNLEIIKVTNRSTDTFTIVRAQGGTTAQAYAIGSRIELRPVAELFNALPNRELQTADYADASITAAKLAITGVTAGNYGGLGKAMAITVNSKGQITALSNANGFVQRNQFDFTTSGATQTWTKPIGAGKLVRVQVWGGGGGGSRSGNGTGGGGGGGGAYAEAWFSIDDLSATASIVVAGGGAGATTDNGTGGVGETSTFTSGATVLRAYGGGGGQANSGGPNAAGGGGGGVFSAGSSGNSGTGGTAGRLGGGTGGNYETIGGDAVNIWGGAGGGGGSGGGSGGIGGAAIWGGGGGGGADDSTAPSFTGGAGGTSLFGGAGGAGRGGTGAGVNGVVPAGGGGGTEQANAGNGANGRVIVTVY